MAVRRGMRSLLAATAVSSVGDGVFVAAAPLAAATVTRNPGAVALVTTAECLPWIVVAPFAGYYVDRWPKRPTMIVADLARTVLVAVLAVAVAVEAAPIPTLALCAFGVAAGNVFHSASVEATIARITARDHAVLPRSNGHQQVASTGGRQLFGPPLGSLSFTAARWLPFALDAASFLASAVLLADLPAERVRRDDAPGLWRSLRRSTHFLLSHRDLRTLAVLTAVANVNAYLVLSILVLYATDAGGLRMSEAGYGVLLIAMAAGGVTGGLLAPQLIGRLGSRTTIITGLGGEGVAWLLVASTHEPAVAGVALAMASVGLSCVSIVVTTARQSQVPPELLGQVISAFRMIGNGIGPVGALAGGALAMWAGLRVPILLAAAVALVTVLLAALPGSAGYIGIRR